MYLVSGSTEVVVLAANALHDSGGVCVCVCVCVWRKQQYPHTVHTQSQALFTSKGPCDITRCNHYTHRPLFTSHYGLLHSQALWPLMAGTPYTVPANTTPLPSSSCDRHMTRKENVVASFSEPPPPPPPNTDRENFLSDYRWKNMLW